MSLSIQQRDHLHRLLGELEREVEDFGLLRKLVVEGYEEEDLARRIGIPASTLRYRVRRARTAAREYLRKCGGWAELGGERLLRRADFPSLPG